MRKIAVTGLILAVNCGMLAVTGFAHHGTAEYDNAKTISLRGTVTSFRYLNPHVLIYIDVKEDNNQVSEWIAESQSPNLLSRRGWSRSNPETRR